MIKKIIAFAAAVVIAASMSTISAFASGTTYEDLVQAAKEGGFMSHNVEELDCFLQEHKDCFTGDDYDYMIADLNKIRDIYIAPYCIGGFKEKVAKAPADLNDKEKITIIKEWTEDEKMAIINDVVNLGKKFNIIVTYTKYIDYDDGSDYDLCYKIQYEHKHDDSPSGGVGRSYPTEVSTETPAEKPTDTVSARKSTDDSESPNAKPDTNNTGSMTSPKTGQEAGVFSVMFGVIFVAVGIIIYTRRKEM